MEIHEFLTRLFEAAYTVPGLDQQEVDKRDSLYRYAAEKYLNPDQSWKDEDTPYQELDIGAFINELIDNAGKPAGLKEKQPDGSYQPITKLDIRKYFPTLTDAGFMIEAQPDILSTEIPTSPMISQKYLNHTLFDKVSIKPGSEVGKLRSPVQAEESSRIKEQEEYIFPQEQPSLPIIKKTIDLAEMPPSPTTTEPDGRRFSGSELDLGKGYLSSPTSTQPGSPVSLTGTEIGFGPFVAGLDSPLSARSTTSTQAAKMVKSPFIKSASYDSFASTSSQITQVGEIPLAPERYSRYWLEKVVDGYTALQALEEAANRINHFGEPKHTEPNAITRNIRTAIERYLSSIEKKHLNITPGNFPAALEQDQIAQKLYSALMQSKQIGFPPGNKAALKECLATINNLTANNTILQEPADYLRVDTTYHTRTTPRW